MTSCWSMADKQKLYWWLFHRYHHYRLAIFSSFLFPYAQTMEDCIPKWIMVSDLNHKHWQNISENALIWCSMSRGCMSSCDSHKHRNQNETFCVQSEVKQFTDVFMIWIINIGKTSLRKLWSGAPWTMDVWAATIPTSIGIKMKPSVFNQKLSNLLMCLWSES